MSSLVLLSGGLDSTVNLYEVCKNEKSAVAIHFQYGQRAAKKEFEKVTALTHLLKIELIVVELPWFKAFSKASSLLEESATIPGRIEVQIDSHEKSLQTAQSVWVPNRNGIFLNIAAGFAEARKLQFVVPGFNAEEASTFPDNSEQFLQKLDASFLLSTGNHVKTKCYTTHMQKSEILERALILKVPLRHLWPCYHSFEKWCGECESCQRFKRALKNNNVSCADWFIR